MHRLTRILVLSLLAAPLSVVHAGAAEPPPGIIPGTAGRDLPAPPDPERSLVLAVLPDRTTGRDWGLRYIEMAVEDLNRIRPDAVLSIGDMIQGYTRSVEQWDREVAEYRAITDRLTMPFYPLAGNHEVVSGTRNRQDLTFQERYQQTFAPLYYAVEFDLASVVVLYSDDPTFGSGFGIGEAQLAWLGTCLERLAARDKPIFVLLHRPLWRSRGSGWAERVHPVLVRHRVHAVIGGHFHSLQRDPDWDGIQYHILGTCGGMIDQLPLAGQLQHLSFIRVRVNGDVSIYHQPVGTTLPDDFVLGIDQDRVNRLKTDDRVVRIRDAADDPFRGPVAATVTAEMFNPIDVPVEITGRVVTAKPEGESWLASTWLSRMEQDRFNPYTTDAETSFRTTGALSRVRLEPGQRKHVVIDLASPAVEAPRNPPEFEFRAFFRDSHGRETPALIRRRLPLRRVIDSGNPMTEWPLCAWDFSVYETLERNPSVRFQRNGNGLVLHLKVPDDRLSGFEAHPRGVIERSTDPPSDAVVILIGEGTTQRRFYIEPQMGLEVVEIRPEAAQPSSIQAEWANWEDDGPGWALTIRLPSEVLIREPGGEAIRINIGIADNDDSYHTQWRWLAPVGLSAWLR